MTRLMSKTSFVVVFLMALLFLNSCHIINVYKKESMADRNRRALNQLQMGMEECDVRRLLKGPWKVESFQSPAGTVQALYYFTQVIHDGSDTMSETTPVFIVNGKVAGWGAGAYTGVAMGLPSSSD